MYRTIQDPYCYASTAILKNRLNLRNQAELDKFEILSAVKRAEEPLPVGRYDYRHYRAIHRHLFQDVYRWAGRIRTVRIAKEGNWFCYPEYIDAGLADNNFLRDIESENFAKEAAHFIAELNAIHPFREGNGRVQNSYLRILADQAGHPLDFERLNRDIMIPAMIASFQGDEGPLSELILQLMRVR
jgi:cell filamentation protein